MSGQIDIVCARALIEAHLASIRFERVEDYLRRGRRYAGRSTTSLKIGWREMEARLDGCHPPDIRQGVSASGVNATSIGYGATPVSGARSSGRSTRGPWRSWKSAAMRSSTEGVEVGPAIRTGI